MIIYLYGPDSYRRKRKLDELVSEYRKKQGESDIFSADLGEEPEKWEAVRDFLNQPSMFVDSKVAVIKGGGTVEEKEWRKVVKGQADTPKTFLLISDDDKPKKDFAFLLEKPVQSQFFAKLEGRLLEAFLYQEAGKRVLTFEPEAWRYLNQYLNEEGESAWRGINELDKLVLADFVQPISLNDLGRLVRWRGSEEVFFLAKQILAGSDARRKLVFLERLFFQREESAYIFNSLAFQARGGALKKMADYDVSVKSGNLEYEEALTDFAIS
jgi:DNA polymerase III delta subunit